MHALFKCAYNLCAYYSSVVLFKYAYFSSACNCTIQLSALYKCVYYSSAIVYLIIHLCSHLEIFSLFFLYLSWPTVSKARKINPLTRGFKEDFAVKFSIGLWNRLCVQPYRPKISPIIMNLVVPLSVQWASIVLLEIQRSIDGMKTMLIRTSTRPPVKSCVVTSLCRNVMQQHGCATFCMVVWLFTLENKGGIFNV